MPRERRRHCTRENTSLESASVNPGLEPVQLDFVRDFTQFCRSEVTIQPTVGQMKAVESLEPRASGDLWIVQHRAVVRGPQSLRQ